MYTNYEILHIDTTEEMVVIKFMEEGRTDYVTRRYYKDELTDELIVSLVEHAQTEAYAFFNKDAESISFTPSSWTGEIRGLVMGDIPEYNPTFEQLEESWVETDELRTRVLNVIELTEAEKVVQILAKREMLLGSTDVNALSDRVISTAMLEYRQALRDITEQEGYPNSVIWPIAPLG
tara:strand:+ start:4091 stop:4624 length:534 start_codon:yes stop_codon:yes gene_type:complete